MATNADVIRELMDLVRKYDLEIYPIAHGVVFSSRENESCYFHFKNMQPDYIDELVIDGKWQSDDQIVKIISRNWFL